MTSIQSSMWLSSGIKIERLTTSGESRSTEYFLESSCFGLTKFITHIKYFLEGDLKCCVQNFNWISCERWATRQGYCPVIVYPGQAARARAGPSLATQPCVPGPGRSEWSPGARPGTNHRAGRGEWTNEEPAVTREGLGRGPAAV